ncbi:MAG TPA: AMP-binding protein [Stellaceae bacterium]|nr:AMP-binding protein [Stellaceae bacterium]
MAAPISASKVASIDWLAEAGPEPMLLLALQQQFDQTQWWPPELLLRQQFRQLARLVEHAYRTTPLYRDRLAAAGYRPGDAITAEFWRRIPPLRRREAQEAQGALVSDRIPPGHGFVAEVATSGSTGLPVRVKKTALVQTMWNAVALREYRWSRCDFAQRLAVIRGPDRVRAPYPAGVAFPDWGPPATFLYRTGPAAALDIHADAGEQAEWLRRTEPCYLLTFPSNALMLARHFRRNGLALPSLRGIWTVSEVVDERLRRACRNAWGVEITDTYSAAEAGYLALQCPEHRHYHVQSETVLVEVLDREGAACAPGETGDVVVTPLHNFATPLLRYEIGDRAEVGGPCPCGRGLPVIRRILGRAKHSLVLPSGGRRHPWLGTDEFAENPAIVQHQVVQRSLEELEFRLVVRRPLTAAEETRLADILRKNLGHPFRVTFRYLDAIPRAPSGRFFEFLSELEQ